MKTNKFENTIRQKLESISPDFQEENWTKMQNYMQVHNPPTFWQQYGSWLGYAAAASVSTVMAFMYVGQLNKTNDLASDVKKLQNQIEVIKSAPASKQKTDTVYIVQKELSKDEFYQRFQPSEIPVSSQKNIVANQNISPESPTYNPALAESNFIKSQYRPQVAELKGNQQNLDASGLDASSQEVAENFENNEIIDNSEIAASKNLNNIPPSLSSFGKTLDGENFNNLAEINPVQISGANRVPYQMNYALANRLSSRQVRKVLLATNSASVKRFEDKKIEKAEKAEKTENIIPKLNIKAPYRFGGGIQFEGPNQVKNVTGEILVSKKFSISTGISWLKVKPMEFFTEKIFREKNRKDFKKSHPDQVPMAFEVLNINVKPTLVQIPLTVAFRNDLNNNFTYFVGAGTNVTVKGREQISFDCRVPNPSHEFLSQSFDKKMNVPVINSLNFSAGLEKSWHPIVVQMEGYLYTYFKPISPESPRTGPGVKLKLLYQIGRKM